MNTTYLERIKEAVAMTLYSYCVRFDYGAAPNPYWGICTLVICKPAIRRKAKKNDWIVGLGRSEDCLSNCVVYAMRVSRRMSMKEYDAFCGESLPGKIPNWSSKQFRRKVGDCVYDFSEPGEPRIRLSVHDERNRVVDRSGKKALLSDHFYYFGDKPVKLPKHLLPIMHPHPGHKSRANAKYALQFVEWIEGLGKKPNKLYGRPRHRKQIMDDPTCRTVCSARDLEDDAKDEEC